MANAELKNVCKIYEGGVKAVNDFNLAIDDKEFVVFVGPSGCGKSTTLRMIAGLEEITSGTLYIDGVLMNDVEPKDRDISMVFQNYALYPHMSVYENMAFSLRIKKLPKDEIDRRVKEAAEILGITEYLDRKPKALSGGQRQRVALGRAIVREPKLFLLDEPLSNLDAKLRVQMRSEIIKLHQRLQTTFVYVTHDQTEAMTMGTRIVVMKDGYIMQVDTPSNLYDHPANDFVATFLGSPQMNLFDAVIERAGEGLVVRLAEFDDDGNEIPSEKSIALKVPPLKAGQLVDDSYIGKKVIFGIRPEDIKESEEGADGAIGVTAEIVEKLGNETLVYTHITGRKDYAIASYAARTPVLIDGVSYMRFDMDRMHLFDAKSGESLLRIPEVNILDVDVKCEEDAVVLSEGRFRSEELKNRLVMSTGEDAKIGLRSEGIGFEERENALAVPVTVDEVIDYGAYKAVYSHTAAGQRVVVKADAEALVPSEGEATVYAPVEAIDIFAADGSRLTARREFAHPVHEDAAVVRSGRVYRINAVVEGVKRSLACRVTALDVFGEKTLMTVRANKSGEVYSFAVPTDTAYYEGMAIYITPPRKKQP